MALVELSEDEMRDLAKLRKERAGHEDNQPRMLTANVTGVEMRSIRELMEASGMDHDEVVALAIKALRSDNLFGI